MGLEIVYRRASIAQAPVELELVTEPDLREVFLGEWEGGDIGSAMARVLL